MEYMEAFGMFYDVPEPEEREAWEYFPVIESITIFGNEDSYGIIQINNSSYLVDEQLEVLIPFVAVEEVK